jgi:hypothetical protein
MNRMMEQKEGKNGEQKNEAAERSSVESRMVRNGEQYNGRSRMAQNGAAEINSGAECKRREEWNRADSVEWREKKGANE